MPRALSFHFQCKHQRDRVRYILSCSQRARAANTTDELQAILFEAAAQMGVRHIWCGAHVDPLRVPEGAILLQNYPPKWVTHYSAMRYCRLDPVHRHAEMTRASFSWGHFDFLSDLGERQARILNEARRHGVGGGYTIPLSHLPGARASCSLIPENGEVDLEAIALLNGLVWEIYGQATLLASGPQSVGTTVRLSRRQRDCLQLMAHGATDVEIAGKLGICVSTVCRHLNIARRRLGGRSRQHAVTLAFRYGHLSW